MKPLWKLPALAAITALLLGPAVVAPAAAGVGDKALVITQVRRPATCIGAVRISQVDGRQRRLPAQGFEIDPGRHTMTGTAVIDAGMNCPIGRGVSRNNIEPLEYDFEAGMKYYVGFDHGSPNRDDWRLVVWKTEPR